MTIIPAAIGSPRPLGSKFSVLENARLLGHYRYAELISMESLCTWLITVEPLEVKIRFCDWIYDDAVHADQLGQRVLELRGSLRKTRAPNHHFIEFCTQLARARSLVEQLVGVFRVLKPHLVDTYEQHLAGSDPLMDAPTVRLLRGMVQQEKLQIEWAERILGELLTSDASRKQATAWEEHLRALLHQAGGVHGSGLVDEEDATLEQRPTVPQPIYKGHPVRDGRFTIVDWREWIGPSTLTKESIREWLHFWINTEMCAAEGCARTIVEFPDLPWELRLLLARQVWDEGRHCEIFCQRVHELGGYFGLTPFNFWLYEQFGGRDDPLERLVGLNRTLEGLAMDTVSSYALRMAEIGDAVSAQTQEYIVADESVHTSIANWIERLASDDPERLRRLRTLQAEREAAIREMHRRRYAAQRS